MRIDEFEFRNKKGQEIEPTKAMLVVYIKALHKDIKTLEKALDTACLVIAKAMCPNGDWEVLKKDFANAYIEQAQKELKKDE